ncbi:MAG TPA: DsbA family protein [Gammaproteobacteria bacterium]|nr:DsbA family protein [Gammaproteobacteria bacterium]
MANSLDKTEAGSRTWIYVGVAAVIVVGVLAWFLIRKPGGQDSAAVDTTPTVSFDARQDTLGVSLGSPQAKVVVREFADYECPACGGFEPVLEQMRKDYVDTGGVRFVFFDYPLEDLHPHAMVAAQAARCAGVQGHYWEMHDMLYAKQQDWAKEADPTSKFQSYANDLKLDSLALLGCLRNGATRQAVRKSQQYGDLLGLHATPSYAVNGIGRAGGITYDELKVLVQHELAATGNGAAKN